MRPDRARKPCCTRVSKASCKTGELGQTVAPVRRPLPGHVSPVTRTDTTGEAREKTGMQEAQDILQSQNLPHVY